MSKAGASKHWQRKKCWQTCSQSGTSGRSYYIL